MNIKTEKISLQVKRASDYSDIIQVVPYVTEKKAGIDNKRDGLHAVPFLIRL
jgi:hypothetical protein